MAWVLADVRRLGENLDAWVAGLQQEQTPEETGVGVRVLIDQAEDLRRRLREAGDTCRGLLREQAPPRHGGGQPPAPAGTVMCPRRGALVVAATSLHAAAHGIGPAASALCEQDHLRATMTSSARITGRFLNTAASALQEVATLDSAPAGKDLTRPTPGSVRHLRLVHQHRPDGGRRPT